MEPNLHHRTGPGWIEVIYGPMFSGKTEEFIQRLEQAHTDGQHVEAFKPALDRRYAETAIVSHNKTAFPATPVDTPSHILHLTEGASIVGIDEAQFFDNTLVEVCQRLAGRGCRVIVAGLDLDYLGQPFEPVPQLIAVARYVTRLHAICALCGTPASHTQRTVQDDEQILVGAKEAYEPHCHRCFTPSALPTPSSRAPSNPPANPS